MSDHLVPPDSCRLERCDIGVCEAMCCYDGVYFMNDEEEAAIRLVVKEFPEHFSWLPEDFVQDGYWEGQLFGRKTLTVPHRYQSSQFPSHFAQTRCVFAEANGYCSLETLARSQNLHPWTYKPSTCWIHPADDTGDGLTAPPLSSEDDPFNLGPAYPGYVSFTSCGRNCGEGCGQPWTEALQAERDYYETVQDQVNYGNSMAKIRSILERLKSGK